MPPVLQTRSNSAAALVLVRREHHAEGREHGVEASRRRSGSASASASLNSTDRPFGRGTRAAAFEQRSARSRSRSSHQRRAAAGVALPLATRRAFWPPGRAPRSPTDLRPGARRALHTVIELPVPMASRALWRAAMRASRPTIGCHCRHFRPDLATPVPELYRQDPARRAARDRARMRPARAAAGDARRQDHGRGAALRLSAFRAILDRVSPQLWRDTIADADAAGRLYGLARRNALRACAGPRPAGDGVRADRGGGGKSRNGGRSAPTISSPH